MRVLNDQRRRSPERSSEIADLGWSLHQELIQLPERFRAAVVLCDIEGLSYQQAAAQLNVPLGTLQSRLARARNRLRNRLIRRGISAFDPAHAPDSANILFAAGASRLTPPGALGREVRRQCLMLVAEPAQFQAIVSRSVQSLMSKGSKSMQFIRWNGFALIPTAAVVVCGGFLLNNQTNAQPRQDIEQDRKAASAGAKSETVNSAATRPESLVIPVIREAAAAAGRGKVLVYALDAKGRRIPGEPVPAKRRRRRREPADQKGDRLLNGPPAPERPDKEVIVDMSWALVTGVVDQRVIEQSLANGDRVGQLWAEQVYRRVDLERQERSATDRWSDWPRSIPNRRFESSTTSPSTTRK